jgi:formylglycine-generating enzyme required for sulfatase activity
VYRIILVLAIAGLPPTDDASSEEPHPAASGSELDLRGVRPGETRDDNGLKIVFVWCPPGAFTMEDVMMERENTQQPRQKPEIRPADDDEVVDDVKVPEEVLDQELIGGGVGVEKTVRVRAFLREGYWLGKNEVTQGQWKKLMETRPWQGQHQTKAGDDFPATYIDWHDVDRFCRKLTDQERDAGRLPRNWEYALPTEAQWERACRARSETRFCFGDDESEFGEYGWCQANTVNAGEDYAHRVGRKKPNAWGLYDMHGNIWEWCRDVYQDKLPGGRDPEATGPGTERVMRGGGIYREPHECRSSFRHHHKPDWRLFDLGFRVALSRAASR